MDDGAALSAELGRGTGAGRCTTRSPAARAHWMADRQGRMHNLTAFDAHNYGPRKRRAAAAEYSFPNLSDERARSAEPGRAALRAR